MNRFKRLDLVDRVPKELQIEIHNILQDTVTKIIKKKEEMQEDKLVVYGGLQIAEKAKGKRRKGKGERERYNSTECRILENIKER